MYEIKIIRKGIEHQNIGGKEFIIDERVTKTLNPHKIVSEAEKGNYACSNFIKRRHDFDENFQLKLYYGKVEGLGYIMAEDEFEREV